MTTVQVKRDGKILDSYSTKDDWLEVVKVYATQDYRTVRANDNTITLAKGPVTVEVKK